MTTRTPREVGGGEGGEDGEVYRHTHHQQPEQQPEVVFNNHVVTTSTPQTSAAAAVPSEQRISFEQPQSFEDEDDEEVSVEHLSHTIWFFLNDCTVSIFSTHDSDMFLPYFLHMLVIL